MTDLVLGTGPGRFSCGEVYGWFRPWRVQQLELACRCGRSRCEVWQAIGRPRPSRFHTTVARVTGADVVVDSSKSLPWICDSAVWAGRNGFDVTMVLTWKSPRRLAKSYYRRDPGEASVARAMRRFVTYYRGALKLPIRCVAVCNDDLAARPRETVRSLMSALSLEYHEDQEAFWRWEHHHVRGSVSAADQLRGRGWSLQNPEPEGFAEVWDALGFDEDATVAAIVEELEALDHRRVEPGRPLPAADPPKVSVLGRPPWVWRLRAKDLWKTTKLGVRNRGLRRSYA